MRKAFNFYRSYFDIAKELPEKDRLQFLMAILEKQFEGIEPNLKGLSNFAYISQKHSIDSQVLGYETKTGVKLTPTDGGIKGGIKGASVQEKGEVQEKEKGEEEFIILLSLFSTILSKTFRSTTNLQNFNARIKEGFTLDNFKTALENIKKDSYHKETNYKHITPEFICRVDKLEKFLSQSPEKKPQLEPDDYGRD